MYDLKEKRVLIVGLGKSGVAAAIFAASRGSRVTVTDMRSERELADELASLKGCSVKKDLGGHDSRVFEEADMIVVSPGVPSDLPELVNARQRGVQVVGEMELALQEITKPIIAVTGTNGKTTATALIGHLMSSCGIPHCVGGNIGTPLISMVSQANEVEWVVAEVSSFQLETSPSLKAHIAIWLNATPDHLDRHQSFESYVEAKARLFAPLTPESWGIYNTVDEVVRGAVLPSRATLVPFDAVGVRMDGGWYEDGDLWVDLEKRGRYRFNLQKVSLEGKHNRENMLAAILATLLAGGNPESIQDGLESFEGLPHRLQFVAESSGVRFYDDSKGTNVGATIRALDSFAEPVVLIAGGLDKGGDFEKLKDNVEKGVKKLILIGQATGRMKDALGDCAEIATADSMEDAVRKAWDVSEPGEVVLLSPACASFDMFKDYAARGDAFQDAIRKMTRKRKRRAR